MVSWEKMKPFTGGFSMLNNKKIRNMVKLATYENKEGKEDIKMSKYYKSDYVRYNILKTVVSVTVAYLLILLMTAVYYSEYLIQEAVKLDYRSIGIKALAVYILILTAYIIGSVFGYNLKYEKSRGRLARYYKRLRALSKQYREKNN